MAEVLLVGGLQVETDPPDVHPRTRVQDTEAANLSVE